MSIVFDKNTKIEAVHDDALPQASRRASTDVHVFRVKDGKAMMADSGSGGEGQGVSGLANSKQCKQRQVLI